MRPLRFLHPKPPRFILGAFVHDYAPFTLLGGQRLKVEFLLELRDLREVVSNVRSGPNTHAWPVWRLPIPIVV
jgi:hypothetical protein